MNSAVTDRASFAVSSITAASNGSHAADTSATAANLVGSTNPAVEGVRAADLTYDELLDYYCSLVFSRAEHLTAAASELQKHRATVQARVRPDLVAAFRSRRTDS